MPDGGLILPGSPDYERISRAAFARWTQLRYHPVQQAYVASPHRFNVIPAGRRSGKTEIFKRKVINKALEAAFPWEPRFFAGAPTRDQAKRIFWEDLKLLSPKHLVVDISEGELYIEYVNAARLYVIGMDKPERIEGSPWDGGGLDEFGNMKPRTFKENVRPALSDRNGWCDLFGVPEGRNHYYDVAMDARALMKEQGAKSDWGYFHWKSADILPASEIEAALRDLDELTFKQEYEASFVNFEGRAYYVFDAEIHTAPLRERYNPKAPLGFCFDFNVEPGVAQIVQEGKLPLPGEPLGTMVLGEVHIARNSNTPAVCRKLLQDWGKHQGEVRCYGDATGGARGSAKVEGSDWELIEKELRPVFKQRLDMRVKESNPKERARVNAVNSRFLSANGEIRMLVDAQHSKYTVRDLEGVTLLKGGSGEIDKKDDLSITHHTDALGYFVEYEYPVDGEKLERVRLLGF